MSKVYSFRLDEENPREAQAREVIEARVGEGYSLRYIVVEALLSFKKEEVEHSELNEVVEQLQNLILYLDKRPLAQTSGDLLPNSFLDAIKQSARTGIDIGN